MKPEHPDKIVLLGTIGSHSYGTATPESDYDYMGVVIPSEDVYLGMKNWGQAGTMEHGEDDIVKGFVESKYYELKKFMGMCAGMNPNAIPTLWLHPGHYEVLTPEGQMLVDNRTIFNSKAAYHTFAGYANGQLKKMGGVFNDDEEDNLKLRDGYIRIQNEFLDKEIATQREYRDAKPEDFPTGSLRAQVLNQAYDSGYLNALIALRTHSQEEVKRIKIGPITGRMGAKRKELREKFGYDTKFAFHTIRLMRMCIEFLKNPQNGLLVYRREIDADFLYSIREGKFSQEEIKKMADDLFAEAKEALPKTELPDKPNHEAIHTLTMDMIRSSLGIKSGEKMRALAKALEAYYYEPIV